MSNNRKLATNSQLNILIFEANTSVIEAKRQKVGPGG